ncbi:MAG: glycosyl hydrolase, partial [Betaproteobacteria bacterium]
GRVQCVLAAGENGERLLLTDRVTAERGLDWTAPAGRWRVYFAVARGPLQEVKRAAPGGEGHVLDPFSVAALRRYLGRFDEALAGGHGGTLRAQFHDSFEYYGASWTPTLFDAFSRARGYDLRQELPALAGDGPEDEVARVMGDYRETLSDLHLAYVRAWTAWAHARSNLTRNQAHGAPGNLVDLYAAADIPETEVFGSAEEAQLPRLKLSSSAAHVGGRPLASAEAFTWLGEHFQVSLAQARTAADWLFLSGVNQLVLHGIPYSPRQAPWPGWQFYAAVNFGPTGGLWRDLPELLAYLTRCQSVLQAGEPDEDVLLYYPVHDAWHGAGKLVLPNPLPPAFQDVGLALWRRGYAWDAVSDRLLEQATVSGGRLQLGAGRYRAVVVPPARVMPVSTLRRLLGLARAGATVAFVGDPPADVPGLAELEARRLELHEALRSLGLVAGEPPRSGPYAVGGGTVWTGKDVLELLARAQVPREPMVDAGVQFVRRRDARGRWYFVVNRRAEAVDGWLALGTRARSVVRLDPRSAAAGGLLPLRQAADGAVEVELRLQPGESAALRTLTDEAAEAPRWPAYDAAGEPVPLAGSWRVSFVDGGPVLPAAFETRSLASWTEIGGEEGRRFAGTALYTIRFPRPGGSADDWELDLGRVADSARVRLNGRPLGAAWCPPFRLRVGSALKAGANTLEVEVTNAAANRVRDLDRRGVSWKTFHDANVVGKDYKPLDASGWPLRPSGLLGPVTLQPLRARGGQGPLARPAGR